MCDQPQPGPSYRREKLHKKIYNGYIYNREKDSKKNQNIM